MRTLLHFFLFVFFTSNAFSQSSYFIHYKTYYIKSDSILLKGGVDLILAIKDSQSYTFSPEGKYDPPIQYPLGSSLIPKSTYVNINKKLLITPFGYPKEPKTHALIIYDFPDNKWKITDEKKVILGDTCIKAIGKVGETNIIAWYSPRLPAGFGIYHYIGLPGTVLETYMIDRNIQTVAVEIEEVCPDIIEPTYARKVSAETFKRRRDNANGKIHWREKDFINE